MRSAGLGTIRFGSANSHDLGRAALFHPQTRQTLLAQNAKTVPDGRRFVGRNLELTCVMKFDFTTVAAYYEALAGASSTLWSSRDLV